jgi:hypothetical protein
MSAAEWVGGTNPYYARENIESNMKAIMPPRPELSEIKKEELRARGWTEEKINALAEKYIEAGKQWDEMFRKAVELRLPGAKGGARRRTAHRKSRRTSRAYRKGSRSAGRTAYRKSQRR